MVEKLTDAAVCVIDSHKFAFSYYKNATIGNGKSKGKGKGKVGRKCFYTRDNLIVLWGAEQGQGGQG